MLQHWPDLGGFAAEKKRRQAEVKSRDSKYIMSIATTL